MDALVADGASQQSGYRPVRGTAENEQLCWASGAKEFLSYQSVMESLSATFGEHRNLVYDFPTTAVMPQDYIGSGQDRMYKFRWEAEKIHRFRGAHWSNIRVTPTFLKARDVQKDIRQTVRRISAVRPPRSSSLQFMKERRLASPWAPATLSARASSSP